MNDWIRLKCLSRLSEILCRTNKNCLGSGWKTVVRKVMERCLHLFTLSMCMKGAIKIRRMKERKGKESKAKQSKVKQSKAKQSKVKQNKTKQSKAKQNKAKQNKAKQSKTKQNKTKQSKCKAKQSKAKQSKAKQSKAKQRKKTFDKVLIISATVLASACPDISQKHFAISMDSGCWRQWSQIERN